MLIEDAFGSFNNVRVLMEKEISTIDSNLSSYTHTNRRMNFGSTRIKYIKAFTHWVHDFYRVSGLPSIFGLWEVTYKPQLNRETTRDNITRSMENQTNTLEDVESPGPLENEKQWENWEEKLVNYATSHIGANGVPISYLICEMRSQLSTVNIHTLRIKKWLAHHCKGNVMLMIK